MNDQWTKPFYGVQHVGRASLDPFSLGATVVDCETWFELTCWNPTNIWQSSQYMFETLDKATKAGEKYIKTGIHPAKRHKLR